MFNGSHAKMLAKAQLTGAFLPLCLIVFLPSLISALLTSLTAGLGSIVAYLITPMLTLGVSLAFICRAEEEEYSVAQVFNYYPMWWTAFKASFLVGLRVFLWSLLLVIPGIIEGYRCSMVFYILAENPDLTASEAIALSHDMTRGALWDLFLFDLSFFGWFLLSAFTGGLALLWVLPYHTAALTNVYLMLKQGYCNDEYQPHY